MAHHAIAVVGAGPRGTGVLERICASVPELAPRARLTVHVVDPAPPGAGAVWRTDQPAGLLMNTVASQVTVFTDASVECAGPVRPGPSLHEWAGGTVGPDDYPTRACYGRYLAWAFARTVRTAPENVVVLTHRARAVRLTEDPAEERPPLQALTLDTGRTLRGLSAVVLAQGHLPAVATGEEARLSAYAARHGLRHVPPANPADVDLGGVSPGEAVLLRGLGLNFFDHLALLTTGRGGSFAPRGGGLVYRPSGREPRLYAGSRRGVPYQARGDNQKGTCARHTPLLLTPEVIDGFRKRAASGAAPDFLAEVWPLVAAEVEAVHYATLLAGRGLPVARFHDRFLPAALARDPRGVREVLAGFGIGPADRWDWAAVARPYGGRRFEGPADFRAWLLAHLRRDAERARGGNVRDPVKAALDVLRDLRNELRQIVDHGGLTGASHREHLDGWYTPLNAFLSIGPPRRRIEETAALIEAGVLEVLGPGLEVTTGAPGGGPGFGARSAVVPGSAVSVTTVVEARLPAPDVRRTGDALLAGLLRTGQCRAHRVGGHVTGGLDVTPSPYRLVDARGRAHPRRFAVGVPTEGVRWVTAAGARPGVNSVTLADADAVARAVLRTCCGLPSGTTNQELELASTD